MSNALAIAGVTAVLQYYLNNLYAGVASNFPSAVTVSCLAPDQVQNSIVGGAGTADSENQVNLFLHQVSHNAAWRNVDLASMSSDGTRRVGNPPLALNLHYLLTAYGSDYWQAEALLGYALMMLHEAPTLTRQDISEAITVLTTLPYPYPTNKLSGFLNTAGLSDQIEMIKVTPESLSREEMAWLWTALKADYRPTFPFQVSVVLMQPQLGSSFALPVLKTVFGPSTQPTDGPAPLQPPQILTVETPNGQTGALPGDTVTVTGEFLTGATQVSMTNALLGTPLTAAAGDVQGNSLTFKVPSGPPGAFPAGAYQLEVQFMDSTNTIALQATNTLPFGIAPYLPATQTLVSTASGTGTLVTLGGLSPYAWPGQTIVLALSTTSAPLMNTSAQAQPIIGTVPVASLNFLFDEILPTSVQMLARLVVDGVTSVVTANLSVFPPTFTGPWVKL
jgi:hypothetical protein